MKKNKHRLEREQLFFEETAQEFALDSAPKLCSKPHKDRLKVKEKNFSKKLKSEKSGENES